MIYMYLEEPLRAVKASSEILFHQNIEIKGINSTQAYVLIQSKWQTNCIENDFIGVNFHLFLRICNKKLSDIFLSPTSLFPFFSSFSLLLKKNIHVFFVNNHLLLRVLKDTCMWIKFQWVKNTVFTLLITPKNNSTTPQGCSM